MQHSRKSTFPLTELIKSLAPITWMGRCMLAGVIVWFVDWAFVGGDTLFGSHSLKTIVDVASALAFIPLAFFFDQGGAPDSRKPVVAMPPAFDRALSTGRRVATAVDGGAGRARFAGGAGSIECESGRQTARRLSGTIAGRGPGAQP